MIYFDDNCSQDVFQGRLEELLLHECDLCVRPRHPLERLRSLKLKVGIVDRSGRLHPHRGEGRPREPPGGLRLDPPEPEAARQEDGSADQVCRDPLAPVLHFHPDHPDVEELVCDDLVKEMLVPLPQLVMYGLDWSIARLAHPAQLLFKADLPVFSQDTVIHSRAHSSPVLVICYSAKKITFTLSTQLKHKRSIKWSSPSENTIIFTHQFINHERNFPFKSYHLSMRDSQCEIFGKFFLDHPVHVLQAVEPLAQVQVLGERLIGVVGGVQQLVHSVQVIWTHYGKSQSRPQVLKAIIKNPLI